MKIIDLESHGKLRTKWIEYLGGEYNLIEKIKQKGVGSPRLVYQRGIERFDIVCNRSNDINYINIELFRDGIALRFKKEDIFACALIPKNRIDKIDFETFKIKVYYKGKGIIKNAAKISLTTERCRIELLLNVLHYDQGKAFFSKQFFINVINFKDDPSPPLEDNLDGFDAGIFEFLRMI